MCAHTEMICHEDFCPYAAQYGAKMEKSGLVSRIATEMSSFDPDVTFELSKSTEVCPFEVSLELIEQAGFSKLKDFFAWSYDVGSVALCVVGSVMAPACQDG